MLSPSSPVYRAAAPDPRLLRFPTGSARHSTARHWARGMRAYAPLNQHAPPRSTVLTSGGVAATYPAEPFLACFRTPTERAPLLTEPRAHPSRRARRQVRSLDRARGPHRGTATSRRWFRGAAVRPALPQPADVHGRTGPRRCTTAAATSSKPPRSPASIGPTASSSPPTLTPAPAPPPAPACRRRRVQRPARLRRSQAAPGFGDLARPFGVRQPVQAGRGYSSASPATGSHGSGTSRPNAWRVPCSPRRTDRGSGSRA